MSWVAGSVRARLLVAERRLGPAGARELAAAASLHEALALLGRGPYRRDVSLDLGLDEAQHAVAATTLLNLRILAGWLPADALPLLRTLGAWFELANVEDRLAYLAGGALRHPFELGSLAAAWPRAAEAQSLEELRRALAASAWGAIDATTPGEAGFALRLAWACRVDRDAPEVAHWAAGAAALLVAQRLFVSGLPVVPTALLGDAWHGEASVGRFADALPPEAAWALDGMHAPADLWRAETAWWARVEAEAASLMRGSGPGRRVVVGACGLLAADARRTCAALAAVARRGLPGVEETVDAAAA